MNYTKNYQLPQWVESDRVMMEDFNGAMADIDAGVATAQTTADTARTEAAAAQATADAAYSPSQKPYVVGSYTGNGKSVTIELGFRPCFLCIGGQTDGGGSISQFAYYAISGGNASDGELVFTDTGFQVVHTGSYPYLANSGYLYDYIAFK